MIRNYLKIGLRTMSKNKVHSLINITGLGLGMVCCILVLLWIQDELSFDRFHEHGEHLYRIVNEMDGEWTGTSPWALAPTLKKDFPEIEKATRLHTTNLLVKYKDQNFYESIGFVDADFLNMFSFPLVKGDAGSALDVISSVVLSEKTAFKHFQDQDPIGKVIQVNQDMNLTVTGIIKNVPTNSTLTFDLLIPVENVGKERAASWAWETGAFVQLKPNVNVDDLRGKIAGTAHKYDTRMQNKSLNNGLQSISRMHLYGLNSTGPILYVYIFSGVAFIVLLVACINFINLIIAKALVRSKEIGVRKVIGADRKQIMGQFYGEILLMSLFSLALAILIVTLLLPYFNQLAGKQLALNILHNPVLLGGAVCILIVTTLLAGSYPALVLSSLKPIKMLKKTPTVFKESNIRWTLVVLQFVISIVLIVMTIMMSQQIHYIQNKSLGFNREQVISIPMNDEIRKQYDSIKHRLQQYSDIIHVTAATSTPNQINNVNPVYWQGRSPDQFEIINYVIVDYDYFETFEIEFAEGRPFSEAFSTDRQNYIVNQAAINFMKMDSPIGKLFSIWADEGKIIGVVKDFHNQSLHSNITPVVMTFNQYVPMNYIFIRTRPENMRSTLDMIKNIFTELVPNSPFQYEFLDEAFERQYLNETKINTLFQVFSALAIFISCMGLFGLSAHVAQRRTKEIGIRKVAGASVFQIILLMFYDFGKWLVLAMTIAVPIAWYAMDKWLQNFAYHISINGWMFILAGIMTLGIALITISWQTVRVATSNPVNALRYE